MSINPFGSIQRKIEGGFKHLAHEIEAGLHHAGNDIETGLKKVEISAQRNLKSLSAELGKDLKKISTELQDELEGVVSGITSAIVHDAINRALTLLQSPYAPSNFEIEIGPLTLDFSDLGDRVADVIITLEKYADRAPTSKDDIIKFVLALAPSQVTLAIGVSLAFLFVESEDLSVAVRVSWDAGDITEDMLRRVLTIID